LPAPLKVKQNLLNHYYFANGKPNLVFYKRVGIAAAGVWTPGSALLLHLPRKLPFFPSPAPHREFRITAKIPTFLL
jgi:hypothetical protein